MTGSSDIPLTRLGERQVASTVRVLVGPGKLLDPAKVLKVWVSPRQRVISTLQLLFENNDHGSRAEVSAEGSGDTFGGGRGSVETSEEIREWDYGDYEGMLKEEVNELRRRRGVQSADNVWSVWRDGCEGGE